MPSDGNWTLDFYGRDGITLTMLGHEQQRCMDWPAVLANLAEWETAKVPTLEERLSHTAVDANNDGDYPMPGRFRALAATATHDMADAAMLGQSPCLASSIISGEVTEASVTMSS